MTRPDGLGPHHAERTPSRPIWEVKQRRARLVLAWVTGWEYRVLKPAFFFFFSSFKFFSFLFFFSLLLCLPVRACVQVVTSRAVAAARLLEQKKKKKKKKKKKREDVPVEHARRLTLFL